MKISEFNRIIISGNIFNNTQLEFLPNNKKTLRMNYTPKVEFKKGTLINKYI